MKLGKFKRADFEPLSFSVQKSCPFVMNISNFGCDEIFIFYFFPVESGAQKSERKLYNREATRGSPLLSVIAIKTTPNYAILRCFLATGTLYLLPKSLRQKYNELTRQCQGTQLTHCIFAVGILAANTRSR